MQHGTAPWQHPPHRSVSSSSSWSSGFGMPPGQGMPHGIPMQSQQQIAAMAGQVAAVQSMQVQPPSIVGQMVQVQRQAANGAPMLRNGQIVHVHGNHTVALRYDDGSLEDGIPLQSVRPIPHQQLPGSNSFGVTPSSMHMQQASGLHMQQVHLQHSQQFPQPTPQQLQHMQHCWQNRGAPPSQSSFAYAQQQNQQRHPQQAQLLHQQQMAAPPSENVRRKRIGACVDNQENPPIDEREEEEYEEEEEEEDDGRNVMSVIHDMIPKASELLPKPGFFGRLSAGVQRTLIEPALEKLAQIPIDMHVEPPRAKDAHLDSLSVEYSEPAIHEATNGFDTGCILGSGAFGTVYKATMKDGTEVAIKTLKNISLAGFDEEVRVLSRFRHPNIVCLLGFTRHGNGDRSLIYEYLGGGDVSFRLKQSRKSMQRFDAKLRSSVALDAASGLSHLHNATPRSFHRDIKSPNILLDTNGTAKMADFGLACVSQSSEFKVMYASGTAGYACPEYARNGIVTEGSEVHSFGMVLLELITGMPPAVVKQDDSGELDFLVERLQGCPDKVMELLDPTAGFQPERARTLAEIGLACVMRAPADRPLFAQLVEGLRELNSSLRPEARPEAVLRLLQQGVSEQCEVETSDRLPTCEGNFVTHAKLDTCVVAAADAMEDTMPSNVKDVATVSANVQVAPQNSYSVDTYGKEAAKDMITVDANVKAAPLQSRCVDIDVTKADIATVDANIAVPMDRHPEDDSPQRKMTSTRCSLVCVYARGVDLSSLGENDRTITLYEPDDELVVGRSIQAASFWKTLVQSETHQQQISREHAKISFLYSTASEERFCLQCLSSNGLLHNDEHLSKDHGELRTLDHGDIIGFLSKDGALAMNSEESCKPFLAFDVKVPLHLQGEIGDRNGLRGECEDALVGRWWDPDCSLAVPDAAIASLEVFGDSVYMKLPKEARQIFFCQRSYSPEPFDTDIPQNLRIGRYHQRSFWKLALEPEFYAEGCWAFLATDHFDVCLVWPKRQEDNSEPLELFFKVRVLCDRGLHFNHSINLKLGDEQELRPGDIFSVGGLHFKFEPFAEAIAGRIERHTKLSRAPRVASGDDLPVRLLPEDDLCGDTTPHDGLHVETSAPETASENTAMTAGVLRVPVELEPDTP